MEGLCDTRLASPHPKSEAINQSYIVKHTCVTGRLLTVSYGILCVPLKISHVPALDAESPASKPFEDDYPSPQLLSTFPAGRMPCTIHRNT